MSASDRDYHLTVVTKRMAHHGARAGYGSLVPYLAADRVVTVPAHPWVKNLGAITRRLRLGRPPGSDWWGLPSLAAEGGPSPEEILPKASGLAAMVSGYFAARAGLPEIPTASRVRHVQRLQLQAALPWVVRALGLATP